ncbi:hypothetical protein NDU88_006421 [Pleurodeles waltl]|uniref:Uncharacterized protein n=1 Tax=Pleurodeles waltl TaxID=8319 RepID=A0AAV7WG92_PLEWA|nr:hypothetical protein NDU88_006421 [Pleurodeles waltl]
MVPVTGQKGKYVAQRLGVLTAGRWRVAMTSQGHRHWNGIGSSQTLDLRHSSVNEVDRISGCSDARPSWSSDFNQVHGLGAGGFAVPR